MTSKLRTRTVLAAAAVAALLGGAACSDFFTVPNTNQPNLEDLITNPTRAKLSAAATGIFASARGDIQGIVWRLGSLGREGSNLSGDNQPDDQEPYFLAALTGNFGGALWAGRYAAVRNVNIYLTALERVATAEVSDAEKAACRGMANAIEAAASTARGMRATGGACRTACYTAALTDLAASFITNDPADFPSGAYFDFANASGDTPNGLSEPLNGVTFFAHPSDTADAQLQSGGAKDRRVGDKIAPAGKRQVLGGIPEIPGELKFKIYFTGGSVDPGRPIPIIRDEELVLLRAEAEWFTGATLQALADIDLVRQNAGGLAATTLTIASSDAAFVTELLYNRRYSLLWEQGTRWIDARRFNRMADIPAEPPTGGHVAKVMPVPDPECNARGLLSGCEPLTP